MQLKGLSSCLHIFTPQIRDIGVLRTENQNPRFPENVFLLLEILYSLMNSCGLYLTVQYCESGRGADLTSYDRLLGNTSTDTPCTAQFSTVQYLRQHRFDRIDRISIRIRCGFRGAIYRGIKGHLLSPAQLRLQHKHIHSRSTKQPLANAAVSRISPG